MDDRGSGTLSTSFGVGVFLLLMFFSSHVLLNLWTISTVEEAAHQAATSVALADETIDITTVRQRALSRARASLGTYGDEVDFEFQSSPNDPEVILRVRSPELHLLPPVARSALGLGGVDRTIVVRRETKR